jgi:hypothetical protein|tara:strand:+ start:3174 stop:3617 length:444 start_codon:yes stop_codon:yes gene_type:complete
MRKEINNNNNEVNMMNKQTIDYVGISGSQGSSFGFYFTTEENSEIVYTKTYLLKDLVNDLRTKYTLPDSYMASSSMDFATEEGFYHNGAASQVLSLASRIADSGKSIYEYTDKVLDEQTDIRNIEFSGLNKDEAKDWYTDGKVAFNN